MSRTSKRWAINYMKQQSQRKVSKIGSDEALNQAVVALQDGWIWKIGKYKSMTAKQLSEWQDECR